MIIELAFKFLGSFPNISVERDQKYLVEHVLI